MLLFYYHQLSIYINSMPQMQQKIEQSIRNRIQQVTKLVQLSKFSTLCTQSKILSVDFVYFTKFIKYALPGWQNIINLISQFGDSISKIINCTQYTKYGQQLPLLYTAYNKFKQLSKISPNLINQPETYKKSNLNQTSLIFEQLRQHEILNTQLQFLKSHQSTEFFLSLSNQQICLQNQQCVCCSQVFIKKFKIINNNPLISVISQINTKEAFDQNNLQNYITAVCNKGGGIIVIGVVVENGSLIATGIRFKSMQEMKQKEIQMQKAIMNVRNIKQYKIEKVMVHTNYVQPKNIKNQYLRVCFRIFITPAEPRKISYLQSFRVGFHKVYSTYQFDQNLMPKKIMTDPNNPCSGIYKRIHEKYNRFRPRKNSHENIQCFRPHCHNSNIFLKQVHLNGYSSQESSSDENMKIDTEKQLKFKYQHTSLIAIASQKQQKRIIDDLTLAFNDRKIVHQWHKPYERDFKQGRSVWMLSHNRKFNIIKEIWKMVINQYKEKTKGANVLMPVFKTLQIDRLMLSEQNLAYISNKVFNNFEESIKMGVVKKYVGKQQKDLTYLQFGCMSQSIYAYKVFEELGLAPYFTDEVNC